MLSPINSFFLGLFCAAILAQIFIPIFLKTRLKKTNFKGDQILGSTGIFLPLSITAYLALIWFIFPESFYGIIYENKAVLFLILALSSLGLLDDFFGKRDTGGFRGHFGLLLKGELTTGAVKAIGGGLAALIALYPTSKSLPDLVIKTIALALFINVFNLLDLRPGRALKVFIILGMCIVASLTGSSSILWAAILSISFVLVLVDLCELGMLGDAGSNLLGGISGYHLILRSSIIANLLVLLVLLGINLYSEKRSISELIERTPILKWFDDLGRKA